MRGLTVSAAIPASALLVLLTLFASVLSPAIALAQTPPSESDVEYYHADAAGSVRLITNATGAVVSRHDYTPFGTPYGAGSPGQEPRGFTGKERDAETGLNYFGARYYLADSGRFSTVDPAYVQDDNLDDPQRWHRYAYGRNNPFRYTDPDGRLIDVLWDAANVLMGAKSAYDNFRAGNYKSGALDTAGAVVDLAAAIVPGIPGGVGTAIKAARAVEKADDAVEAITVVSISRKLHPEAAAHVDDAIKSGKPSVLTIDRPGTSARRAEAMKGQTKVKGKDLDEYPPAMFKEGGAGASVRPISPHDNRSAGACIGNACRLLPDATQVKIEVK